MAENKKILIVDDEKKLLDLLAFRLQHEGYTVLYASCGKEAFTLVDKEKPNVIILDIMLPDISGYDICKRLKKDKKTTHIKVIMLTAKGRGEDKETGMLAGADEYITKPFRMKILNDKIQKILI